MRRSLLLLTLSALALGPAARGASADDTPKIRSVSPTSGSRGSTVDVTIEGSNLSPYDELKCSRPEISMVVQPVPSPFKLVLRLVIPDAAVAGPVEISIRTKTGVVKTDKFTVKLRSPLITKATPSTVVRGSEYDVRLDGSNLSFLGQESAVTTDAPMTVKVKGKPTDKSMTVHVVVPSSTPVGTHPLTVETTDGKISTNLTVALAPPSIAKIAPTSIARGAEADVTITGKNLTAAMPVVLAVPEATVTVTTKGAATEGSITVHVAARADAPIGPRLLVVQTPDGTASSRLEVVTAAPRLVGLKPAGAARGTDVVVAATVEGAAGGGGAGGYTLRVMPDDPAIKVTKEPSGSFKFAVAADAMPGSRTVVLDHPFGASTAQFLVSVRAPSVAGLNPAEIAPGAEADVIVEGMTLEGATVSLAVEDPKVVLKPGSAPTIVHVTAAADARPGPRPLVVRTADGAAVTVLNVAGMTTSAPVLSATGTPARIARGRSTEVSFTGVNLRSAGDQPPTVTASTTFGPVPATIVASSSTSLRVRLEPPADVDATACVVAVTTSEGAAAGVVTVLAAAPSLAIVTPSRLNRPGDVQVVLGGTDLIPPTGRPPSVALVRHDGSATIEGKIDSAGSEKITATLPLVDSTAIGAWVLVVTTCEGGTAMPVPVDPVVPTIDTIEPAMLGTPANVVFTVKGRNFLTAAGKPPVLSVTRLGSASNLRPELLDAKADSMQVRLSTPAGSAAGPHVLVVKTADGTSAVLFDVVDAPMPVITALEPAEGPRLATVTVMLKGKGLLGTSAVTFSGTGVTAVIQPGATDTVVPLRVTVSGEAEPGKRTVTVTAPGGQTSNEKFTFTVQK